MLFPRMAVTISAKGWHGAHLPLIGNGLTDADQQKEIDMKSSRREFLLSAAACGVDGDGQGDDRGDWIVRALRVSDGPGGTFKMSAYPRGTLLILR